MEFDFHKINSFFSSIDQLIISGNVQQCETQVQKKGTPKIEDKLDEKESVKDTTTKQS